MRGLTGYARLSGPDGTQEWDTFTCFHCNSIRHDDPKQQDTHWCYQCFNRICENCKARARCEPFERKLERMEARAAARRSYG